MTFGWLSSGGPSIVCFVKPAIDNHTVSLLSTLIEKRRHKREKVVLFYFLVTLDT